MKPYRVVFHLNEGGHSKVEGVLGNIANLIEDLGTDQVDVELVAHSDGLLALLQSTHLAEDKIRELAERGVRFAACNNTMQSRNIGEDALLDVAEIVPSGVGELVKRQAEGWIYVRP